MGQIKTHLIEEQQVQSMDQFRANEIIQKKSSEDIELHTKPIDVISVDEQQEKWGRIRRKLQAELGDDIFNSWFPRLTFDAITDTTAHFSVPTRFLKQWIESHYVERLLKLTDEEFEGRVNRVTINLRTAIRANKSKAAQQVAASKPSENAQRAEVSPLHSDPATITRAMNVEGPNGGSPLDPKYTFESFCKGVANEVAFSAAKAIAHDQASGHSFNPLFIHAGVGMGKTHLLQAIAWETQAKTPSRKVLYLTSERFMYKMADAFKNKSALELKKHLEGIDVLLIDDVQFLQGDRFQMEFCHVINVLIDANKQVVVAGDRAPCELTELDQRVRSRMMGGVSFKLDNPDRDLRRSILDSRLETVRATDPSIDVPEAVLDYVAMAVSTNGRDLEGALNRLIAQQCYTGTPVTMESAELVLKDLVRANEPRKVMIEDIQQTVASHFKISKNDLTSQRRTRAIVRPRQVAMYLSKMMTPRSLPDIGRRFGNRDHTTVIHAVHKVEKMMEEDKRFKDDVELLRKILNSR